MDVELLHPYDVRPSDFQVLLFSFDLLLFDVNKPGYGELKH